MRPDAARFRTMATASLRGENAPSSPIRKLVPFADGARARGIEVFHLNIGQPDIETPAVMREALRSYGAEVIAYGPSGGDAPFREFLTSYYAGLGVDLAPSDLLVTTGGSEAVLFALSSASDAPGRRASRARAEGKSPARRLRATTSQKRSSRKRSPRSSARFTRVRTRTSTPFRNGGGLSGSSRRRFCASRPCPVRSGWRFGNPRWRCPWRRS